MTLEQMLALASFGCMAVTLLIAIGIWRGRQEAADKAAEKAIQHTQEIFGVRLEKLELQQTAHGDKIEMRIRIVDGDLSGLKLQISDVKTRLTESEQERREEFQRLHKIGNETHALIVQHLTKLQESYIPRAEYEARHDDVERRVSRLEQKP